VGQKKWTNWDDICFLPKWWDRRIASYPHPSHDPDGAQLSAHAYRRLTYFLGFRNPVILLVLKVKVMDTLVLWKSQ
jgi:hypothetical protein